jgi:hypothetical protein
MVEENLLTGEMELTDSSVRMVAYGNRQVKSPSGLTTNPRQGVFCQG